MARSFWKIILLAVLLGCFVPAVRAQSGACPIGYQPSVHSRDAGGSQHIIACLNPATGLYYWLAGIGFSDSGTFTDSVNDAGSQFMLNGATVNDYNLIQGGSHFTTDAISVGEIVPASSTKWQGNAVGIYGRNYSTSTNAVPAYMQEICEVNGSSCWGINPVVADITGLTSNVTLVSEFDFQPQNASSAYKNIGLMASLYAVQAGSFGTAFSLTTGQVGQWGGGLQSTTGSLPATGDLIHAWPSCVATASVNCVSPVIWEADEYYWNGTAGTSAVQWKLQTQIGSGTNPTYDNVVVNASGGPGGMSHSWLIGQGVQFGQISPGGTTDFWYVRNAAPSGSCTNGSLWSNTAGASGTTLYVCVSSAWVDLK